MKRQTRSRNTWLALILILVLGLLAAYGAYDFADRENRENIELRAAAASGHLPIESIESLGGNDADLERPEYAVLKQYLTDELAWQKDVRFLYLLGKDEDGEFFFYADSEASTSRDYSPPGQRYPEATAKMYTAFDTDTSAIEGPVRDRWGSWVSVYVPVRTYAGERALFGMDISATRYYLKLILFPLVMLLAAAGLLSLHALFMRSRQKGHGT